MPLLVSLTKGCSLTNYRGLRKCYYLLIESRNIGVYRAAAQVIEERQVFANICCCPAAEEAVQQALITS